MTKIKYTITFLFLGLFLIGCQRGCTTVSTLDSESKSVKIGGEKVIITARLVDYRNSRAIDRRNVFKRKVTHTYGITFDIRSRLYSDSDFYSEGVDDPDKVNLKKALKRAKVAISKDKKHVALGIDNEVSQIVHLFKGKPMRSDVYDAISTPDNWAQLDINSFPSPREMLIAQIEDRCSMIMMNEDALRELLDKSSPNDKAHHKLLAQWPECDFAIEYYDAKQVARCSQNKNWKKRAEQQAIKALEESSRVSMRFEDEFNDFLKGLQSDLVFSAMDQMLVDKWGNQSVESSQLIARVEDKSRPMTASHKKQIVAKAKTALNKFIRTGHSSHKCEASDCIRVLIASGESEEIDAFLENAVSKPSHYYVYDLFECLFDVYDKYSPSQQKLISENLDDIMASLPDYARDSMIRNGEKIIPCDQIRKWIKEYPEDLDASDLPKGC